MSGGGVRSSIPSNVRKTIQNIKEITGNHSEEEIYATLKDCSMDPNETAQKLLLQGNFFYLSLLLLLLACGFPFWFSFKLIIFRGYDFRFNGFAVIHVLDLRI